MSMKTFQLKAILVDKNNNPLSGKTIKFYYRKKDEPTYIQFSPDKVTDSNGVAVSDKVQLVDQEYYFKAVFEGDANYEGSYAEKLYTPKAIVPFDITQMIFLMIMMLMMFLIMSVMGIFSFPKEEEEEEKRKRKKREKREEEEEESETH